MTPLSKALLSLLKYLFWTAIVSSTAVVLDPEFMKTVPVPAYWIPIAAAVLKAIATYAATRAAETKP